MLNRISAKPAHRCLATATPQVCGPTPGCLATESELCKVCGPLFSNSEASALSTPDRLFLVESNLSPRETFGFFQGGWGNPLEMSTVPGMHTQCTQGRGGTSGFVPGLVMAEASRACAHKCPPRVRGGGAQTWQLWREVKPRIPFFLPVLFLDSFIYLGDDRVPGWRQEPLKF